MGRDGRESVAQSKLPQPPPRDALGPCARCHREGGIVIHGERRLPQQAVLHPNHVHVRFGAFGKVEVARRGPREPLCGWHVELAAWEEQQRASEDTAYPEPAWCSEAAEQPDVKRIIAKILAVERGENPFPLHAAPDPNETRERLAVAMREPGDETDEGGA